MTLPPSRASDNALSFHLLRCDNCGNHHWLKTPAQAPICGCGAWSWLEQYTFHATDNGPGLHPTQTSPLTLSLNLIAGKLSELNRRHLASGGRAALQLEDFTWRERALDLHHRVGLLWLEAEHGERPPMDHVLSVGAACLAFVMALDAAEVIDVASGEAA